MAELDLFERRLHAALVRRVGGGPIEFDAAAFAHEVAVKEPRRHGLGATLRWVSPVRTLAWLALLALLLIALGAGLLVVGALRQTPYPALHDVALVPTGIDVLTQDTGAYGRAVVDGGGKIWALGDGRLVRFDPASGSARTWTVSDDAAFEMDVIAPAGAGGVWLVQGRMLRWFDGTTFRTVVEAPADIAVAAEAPDGSVWVATTDGVVTPLDRLVVDERRPRPAERGRQPSRRSPSMRRGGPGSAGLRYPWPPGTGSVSRYDGSGWTTFDGTDASPLGSPVWDIAQLPGWGGLGGQRRRDRPVRRVLLDRGSRPRPGPAPPRWRWLQRRTVRPGCGRPGQRGDQLDLRRGSTGDRGHLRPSEGVRGRLYRSAWVIPPRTGCMSGRGRHLPARERSLGAGLAARHLPNGRQDPAGRLAGRAVGARANGIHPTGDSGLWHWQGGHWTNEPIDPDYPHSSAWTAAMAIAPGRDGVGGGRRRGRVLARWPLERASIPRRRSAIAIDKGGAAWVMGMDRSGVWALEPDGTAWARRAIASPPRLGGLGAASLAVDGRGELWLGEPAVWGPGGLARFDGSRWETLDELGGSPIGGATVLGTDPEGAVWIAVARPVDASQTEPTPVLTVRIDGEEQTVVEMPAGNLGTGVLLAPDGTLWVATDHGPARYDGQRWTYPYEGISPSWMGVDRVATDGTVYGSIGGALLRLPALMH